MPNIRIKQSDIDNLSRKLDEISDVLTSEERALLLAVFKLAAASLSGVGTGGGQTESGRLGSAGSSVNVPTSTTISSMPRLSAGFRDAFQPILPGAMNPAGFDIDVHVGW